MVISLGKATKIDHQSNIENVNYAIDITLTVWIQLQIITKRRLPLGDDKVQTQEKTSNNIELILDTKGHLGIQEQYQRKLLLLSLLE